MIKQKLNNIKDSLLYIINQIHFPKMDFFNIFLYYISNQLLNIDFKISKFLKNRCCGQIGLFGIYIYFFFLFYGFPLLYYRIF